MRVYLSGGMEYAEGEGVRWRSDMQEWIEDRLRHSVFNPNVESNRFFSANYPGVNFRTLKNEDLGLFQEIAQKLVELDCKEIAERSDYVICYWDDGAARGAGTKGELTMARFFGKPVYLVTSYKLSDLPAWVLGCATRTFGSFEALKKFLTETK